MIDPDRFITDRLRAIDASGIRRVFDLAANLEKPVNLSIGQPHFDVPDPIKDAAIDAIRAGRNQYTVTQGIADLNAKVRVMIDRDYPQWRGGDYGTLIVSGVSGGLLLALMTCAGPGDEVIIADPYFVMYKHLVTLSGATPVYIDTYPDFQLTAERIAGHITDRTKLVLFNSPANPTGVLADEATCRDVARLCAKRNVLLLSDEIYDTFCYDANPCPSPAAHGSDMLLMRGFSKSYGMTGWRLGWCAGPKPIIEQMAKLQQYTFVCAPSMVQAAGVVALDVDMSDYVEQYRGKRDRVVRTLGDAYELTRPGGTFYAFPKVPQRLGVTASQFVERAIARNLLIVPGSVFSRRDTHFRISYACDDAMLDQGLKILLDLARA
jgi:aspartate aminotransferase/aminotransferase